MKRETLLSAAVVAAILLVAFLGYHLLVVQPQINAQAVEEPLPVYSRGVTNLDDLGLTDDLVFEGATADDYETTLTAVDPTADRIVQIPNVAGYAMIGAGSGKYVYGMNTITGTLTVTHGLTTPQAVFCSLTGDSEANAATCSATISGSTVVVKTWKADGATAGSVGKLVSWIVAGQP